jgi:hypothetical protein
MNKNLFKYNSVCMFVSTFTSSSTCRLQYYGFVLCKSSSRTNFSSSIHLAVCLTTGPKRLPKRALHIVRSRASSLRCSYPLLSLRSSTSFLHLLPCLPVTYILTFVFPSISCCRRQFLRKM